VIIISRHPTFGDALDALFNNDAEDIAVRHVAGKWCVVRDPSAKADYDREQASAGIPYGTDFTW
jgi:hypothetical protein